MENENTESALSLSDIRSKIDATVFAPKTEAVREESPAAIVAAEPTLQVEIPDATGSAQDAEKEIARIVALKRENAELQSKIKEFALHQKRLEEFKTEKEKFDEERSMIEKDPIAFIKKSGWDADVIEAFSKQIRTNQSQPDVRADASLRAAREAHDKVAALQKRMETMEQDLLRKEMMREISSLVSSGDDFEIIRENNLHENVLRTQKEYASLGEEISLEQAARIVERQFEQELKRLSTLKKAKQFFSQPSAAPATAAKKSTSITHQGPTTAPKSEPLTLDEIRARIDREMLA